jgi:signal transduction histidine kinase
MHAPQTVAVRLRPHPRPPEELDGAHIGVVVAERLLVAGLRAQESADESEAARRRLAFLFSASQHLAASLDQAKVLRVLLELVVPEFGDGCIVNLVEPEHRERHATMAISDALSSCSLAWWEWLDRVTRLSIRRALRMGTSDVSSSSHRHRCSPPPSVGHVSSVIVPLVARDRILGSLCMFLLESRKRYGEQDLSVAEALGTQAGLALDNARLYAEQHEVVERLAQTRSQLDAAQRDRLLDDERMRIARDLHDHVEQTFFAIGLAATAALNKTAQANSTHSEHRDALERVAGLADAGADDLRAAIFALNHAEVDGRGLVPALWTLVRNFQSRTGVESDLVLTGSQRRLPTEVAETLHSLAREALANVERHAQAGAVVLGLHMGPRAVTLTIQDDGTGASALVLRQIGRSAIHFGLRGIRDRVRRLNGRFAARPGPEGGFIVRARIPLPRGGEA